MRELALFPSSLEILERSNRLDAFPASYLFAGSDDVLVVMIRNDTSTERSLDLTSQFRVLQIGVKRRTKAATLLALMSAARRIRRAAADTDLVVAYDPHVLAALGWYAVWGRKTAFIVRVICNYELKRTHAHRLSTPLRSAYLERLLERAFYRRADRVLVACTNHFRYVQAAEPSAKLGRYIPAQDEAFYQPRAQPEEPRRHSVIAVSRLHPEKYAEDLVALGTRLASRPDIDFVVFGDGPLRAELEDRVASVGGAVRFLGVRPQNEVRQAMEQAGAVVVLQGGGAIIEAALSASPIVAYDYEMNPDVISTDEAEGWLVPFRDVSALAEAVVGCIDDPAEAARRGCRARQRALDAFGLNRARDVEVSIRRDLGRTS